ncbi:MAG: menaquinone biosynthesis protein [Acidobacteriaceae bacterium]|nr:menaquinone biosynthesis protein [Acidobacteriaceae bacterium]
MPLRVAAISFLNPAPLLYNFEHEPNAADLASRYIRHYTSPALCAQQLQEGNADLGLIPIAKLTPELAIVPGCTIASLQEVRSILLLVKNPQGLPRQQALANVRSIAADAASRSSQAYTHILFEGWLGTRPAFHEFAADPLQMLDQHDAALIIGDPALMARENRELIDQRHHHELLWLDLATLWREHTGLPWVAAVWAVRPSALNAETSATQLVQDCIASRDNGMANVPALVDEWSPRLRLPRDTVQHYLTRNIHYVLDQECQRTIELFRKEAAALRILPELGPLNLL